MNPFLQHGAFSWVELMTPDPQAAIAFYTTVFGWDTEVMEMPEGPYTVVKAGGNGVGAITGMPPDAPPDMPPHWGAIVTVKDVDETMNAVVGNGGTVVVPPMDVPGVGRFFVFKDPQGAVLSAIAYNREMHEEGT